MYISQSDIAKRAKPLSKFRNYRDPLVVLNATKKKDFKSLERLLSEWNFSTDDDKVSYIRTMEIVSEAFNNLSLKEQESVVNIIKESIIPKLDHQTTLQGVNILKSKTSLNESLYEMLKEETIKNKQCSRILKNINNLDKNLQMKTYIEESTNSIDDESAILCIEELCDRINTIQSLDLKEKYSIALESISYNIRKHLPNTDPSNIIYTITEYFLSEGVSFEELEPIVRKNKLYSDNEIDIALESFINEINLFESKDKIKKKEREKCISIFKKEIRNILKKYDMERYVSINNNSNDYTKFLENDKYIELAHADIFKFNPNAEIDQKRIQANGERNKNDEWWEKIESIRKDLNSLLKNNNIKHYIIIEDEQSGWEITVFLLKGKNEKITYEQFIGEKVKISHNNNNKIRDIMDNLKSSNEKSIESLKTTMRKIYTKPKEDVINETPFILGSIRKFFVVGGTLAINPILGVVIGLTDYFIEQEINRPQADKYIKQLEREIKTTERKISEAKKDSTIERLNDYKDKLESQKSKMEDYKDKLYSDTEKYKDDDEDISFEEAAAMILSIEYIMEYSNKDHIRDFDDIILSEATKDDKEKEDKKESKKNIVDDLKDKTKKSIDKTKNKVDKTIKDTKKKSVATLTGVKLAMENLKKKGKNLSTKERQVSQNLDMLMDKYVQKVEDSVTLKSREAVIRGQILPSASKIIKIALTTTAAFAINPAVAVVGSLGAIAVAKTANKKERQLILDELDTHLKIVEKKINQAESDGDTKQLEELYRLQTRLTHERNRIKYKMKATQYQGLY